MKKLKGNEKAFSLNKYNEYTLLINSIIKKLRTENIKDFLYKQIATDLITEVRKRKEDAIYLTIVPAGFMADFIRDVAQNVKKVLTTRFRKEIENLWKESFDLGKKHMIADYLFRIKPFKSILSGVSKFDSLLGYNLALFAEDDIPPIDPTDKQRAIRIARAKRNLTILKNNVNKLKTSGVLYNSFDLDKSSDKAARYTIEEKISFLETLLEIEDFIKKSDLAEKSFLGNEYFNRRYKVLTDDYLANYDLYIKDQISEYLNKNIEGVRQIQNVNTRSDILINKIASELEKQNIDKVDPLLKSERILRTELSIAYNFGKLSGFTSSNDMIRKFRWNADWELEGKTDYEVCESCRLMDGRIYTARDLLITGTRLDRGVLRFEGRSRTSWKNPNLPQIPFHPNCSCYWTLVEKGSEDDIELEEEYPPINQEGLPGTQQEVNNNLLPNAVGAGLVIGGMFLLARSNAWRIFFETVKDITTTTTTTVSPSVVTSIENVYKYIRDFFPSPVEQEVQRTVANIII